MVGVVDVWATLAAIDRAKRTGKGLLAYRNSLRLLKLVNSLLDFPRVEAGRVEASYQPIDIASFMADIASNFCSACELAGLALVIDAPKLEQLVYVDTNMWEKVILNLLSNAFKFTFEGEIRVIVRPSMQASSVEVIVSDTGTGMSPTELPRIFERFHRVEGARSRCLEGSDIGLALVNELVKMHGGSIQVDSEPGCGSSFTLAIPFGHAHLAAASLAEATPLLSATMRASTFV